MKFDRTIQKLTETYEENFPTVHKISKKDVFPHPETSTWKIAYPGGMEDIEFEFKRLAEGGNILVVGETKSGKVFQAVMKPAKGSKIDPGDPETWYPINISSDTGKSVNKRIK